jgi:TolA-binding protein
LHYFFYVHLRLLTRYALFAFGVAFLSMGKDRAHAQSKQNDRAIILQQRSVAFDPDEDISVEQAIEPFRINDDGAATARSLSAIDYETTPSYSTSGLFRSADLFASIARFRARQPQYAQWLNDRMLYSSNPEGRPFAEASLMSALESYSHVPLREEDVSTGLDRLRQLSVASTLPPNIKSEIEFWRAEGERALGYLPEAQSSYDMAARDASEPRMQALALFRRAELEERLGNFIVASSDFTQVRATTGSPLQLLASLRTVALKRTFGDAVGMLYELQRSDSLYAVSTQRLELSARDLDYISPLVEQLYLQTTEESRVLGSLSHPAELKREARPQTQIVSLFFLSEVALLRGTALSELGRYDSASIVLNDGLTALEQAPDTLQRHFVARQRDFIRDALRFERAWAEFKQAHYPLAANEFVQLAEQDTTIRRIISREANLTLREQGHFADLFYEDFGSARVVTLDASLLRHTTFDTAFFIYNDFPERSRFYAGVALARSGKPKEAERLFVGLIQDRSIIYSSRANYQLGLLKFIQKNYVEASSILDPLSSEASLTGAFSALLMGEISYRKNLYEAAERYFRKALSELPDTLVQLRATAALERGLSLLALGEWPQAKHDLAMYLALEPRSTGGRTEEALYWLGRSYFRSGELDSAETKLTRLISEYPNNSRAIDAQYQYAWTLFRKNEFLRAEKSFEQVIALDSITRYAYDAQARAGDSYYALRDYEDAADQYNRAIDRPAFNNLRTARALFQLGLVRMRLDSARSAMNVFHYLLRKFPTSELADRAYFNSAIAAYSIDQPAKAEDDIEHISQALKTSELIPAAWLLAGDQRAMRGSLDDAVTEYQRVLDNYPKSAEAIPALFNMQEALIRSKKYAQALAAADTFISRAPTSKEVPRIVYRKGALEFGLAQWKASAETLRDFIAKYPKDRQVPEARLYLGRSEAIAGDTAAAIEQYTVIVDSYTSDPSSAEAHYELARIRRASAKPEEASHEYSTAFDQQYFSTDAAPKALAEYAEYLVERNKKDSAVTMLHLLADRYTLETRAGARAEIRAAQLLEDLNRKSEAQSVLLRVANARTDMLGGAARIRLGETYLHDSTWRIALAAFTLASTKYPLTEESDVRRLFGIAEASIKLKQKPQAVKALRELINDHTLSERDRERANRLISPLVPARKTKAPAKKGGRR